MKRLNNIIAIIAIFAVMFMALQICIISCSPSANTEPGACETKEDALVDEAKEADALLCTVEELRQMSEKDKKTKADLIKMYKYLRIEGGIVYFDMTKQQAEAEKVDMELYDKMVKSVKEANECATRWKKDGLEFNLEDTDNLLDVIDSRPKSQRGKSTKTSTQSSNKSTETLDIDR